MTAVFPIYHLQVGEWFFWLLPELQFPLLKLVFIPFGFTNLLIHFSAPASTLFIHAFGSSEDLSKDTERRAQWWGTTGPWGSTRCPLLSLCSCMGRDRSSTGARQTLHLAVPTRGENQVSRSGWQLQMLCVQVSRGITSKFGNCQFPSWKTFESLAVKQPTPLVSKFPISSRKL